MASEIAQQSAHLTELAAHAMASARLVESARKDGDVDAARAALWEYEEHCRQLAGIASNLRARLQGMIGRLKERAEREG